MGTIPTTMADEFPDNSQQWNDTDGDGYGDNWILGSGDSCPSTWGNSTRDRNGCLDSGGDGWSENGDDCPDVWGNSTLIGEIASTVMATCIRIKQMSFRMTGHNGVILTGTGMETIHGSEIMGICFE